MSTGTITTRPATSADIVAFYGRLPDRSVRATVYELNGEPAAIFGHYVEGGVRVIFLDISAAVPRLTIWRKAKAAMAQIKGPAVCVAASGSGPFLERLGWAFVADSDEGAVYQWQV